MKKILNKNKVRFEYEINDFVFIPKLNLVDAISDILRYRSELAFSLCGTIYYIYKVADKWFTEDELSPIIDHLKINCEDQNV